MQGAIRRFTGKIWEKVEDWKMKQTITLSQFRDGFRHRQENFSHDGQEALYNFLEEVEEETGSEIEFDPIALCCEFTEYEDLEEAVQVYDSTIINSLQDLRDNALVIEFGNGKLIIQDF